MPPPICAPEEFCTAALRARNRAGIQEVGAPIEIERWRGLAALDRPGPLQDNRGKRAKEESARGCGFISMSPFSAMKPPEDNEQIMIDSIPVMAWRCVWRIATYCQAQQFAHTYAQKHLRSRKRPD